MRLVIVTGMSGAGKTIALKNLEDMGFYCVDNLPILLIEKFAELILSRRNEHEDIALGVDIRSGEDLPMLENIIDKWREISYPFSILFLEANDETLIKRYKETRRSHPLSRTGRIETGITQEREKLGFLRAKADQIVDTSRMLTKELRQSLENLYCAGREKSNLSVTVLSFGFKYGIPADADLVFDVRFLPNPYYVEELRAHTGMESCVQEYVMQGGTLILGCRTGYKNTDGICYMMPMPGYAAELCGTEIEEFTFLSPYDQKQQVKLHDISVSAPCFNDVLSVTNGEVIGTFESNYYSGKPAASHKALGKGNVYYFGAAFAEDTAMAFIELAGICTPLQLNSYMDLPENIELAIRGDAIFLLNYDEETKEINCTGSFQDLITGRIFSDYIQIPAYDAVILKKMNS